LFTTLTEPELAALAARAASRSYGPGQLLFSEGEACKGFFVVASGCIRIFKTSASGREQVLAIEGPGNSVAELPVFDGGNYPASAAALEPSDVVFISINEFRSLCLEHPAVALKVLQVVGKRLRRLVAIIEELSFTTVRQRLISWILRQVEAQGPAFPLAVNQQELAAQIGTVRELVSRNLSRLQAQGMIRVDARELSVIDMQGLRAELTSGV
jgi:CRP/FNR family transcriptional regulator